MNEWFSKFWVRVIKSMANTPMSRRIVYARIVAWILWWTVPSRRKITLTNLRLCFPEKTEAEVVALARSTYRNLARAVLDHGVLWAGTAQQIKDMVRVEGLDYFVDPANRPLIAVAPHFAGLDATGVRLGMEVVGCALYQVQSNPVWDKAILEGRRRFTKSEFVAKSEHNDLRPVIRALREGKPFYYLPDMDHGVRNSVFLPFFGVPAATVPMASRLARLTKARVVFVATEMTADGYLVHVSDPLEGFPTEDYVADTKRLNAEMERLIRKVPDQYMWLHRRFKTRPEGEPSVYD